MYIVIEMQTDASGNVSIPAPASYDNLNDAEAKFHTILAAAAQSTLPVHSAIIVDNEACLIRNERYFHKEG